MRSSISLVWALATTPWRFASTHPRMRSWLASSPPPCACASPGPEIDGRALRLMAEIKDPLVIPRLFGTDGVRGTAGQYPLDPATVRRLGAALVRALPHGPRSPRLLVGRDTRE